jgi:hypothetical protein
MRQATLQLKNRVQNVNILSNNFEIKRIILNTMLSVLAALSIWYVLIVVNMVFDIVERKAMEREVALLINEVGELELSYLALSNSVDTELSRSMGFKEIKATFATRKSLGYGSISENLGNINLAQNEI